MTDENENVTEEATPETQKFITLFQSLIDDEEEIKELRTGIKEAIESFVEENNEKYSKKSVKEAFKYFKKLIKDKQQTVTEDFEIDKIKELITV